MDIGPSALKHGIDAEDIQHPHVDDTGLGSLDPANHPPRDAAGFRRIVAARETIARAEEELRQAAQQRFGRD